MSRNLIIESEARKFVRPLPCLLLISIHSGRLDFGWQHSHSGPAEGRQAHRRRTHLARPKIDLNCDLNYLPFYLHFSLVTWEILDSPLVNCPGRHVPYLCPFHFKTATKERSNVIRIKKYNLFPSLYGSNYEL